MRKVYVQKHKDFDAASFILCL